MGSLGPAYQKFLAAAILVMGLWVLVTSILLPLKQGFDNRAETIADRSFRLAQLRAVNARKQADLPELAVQVERADAIGMLLPEQERGLASANLQARIARILERHSISVVSNQSDAQSADAGLAKVTVSLRVLGDLPSTQAALHDIEKATPYLFIDTVSLRPSRRQAADATISLETNVTISAYMAGGVPS